MNITWTYTMSTGFLDLTGTTDDGGKTIRWSGGYVDEKGARQKLRIVQEQSSPDNFSIAIYEDGPNAPKHPVQKLIYTRKK